MCEFDKCIILLCWKKKYILAFFTEHFTGCFCATSSHFNTSPASFVVSISSYSSRILSSRSLSSLSQIIPTCLRENKGCSFRVGDEAPEDVPVKKEAMQDYNPEGLYSMHRNICTHKDKLHFCFLKF